MTHLADTCAPATFASALVADVAPCLDARHIHVWWVPYVRRDGRMPLKRVLAAYLDRSVDAVELTEGTHGRPALATPAELDFNWSHSGDHAMIAVARYLPQLGVDIEMQRERPRARQLAQRFFAATEAEALGGLPESARSEAFFALWTAKEAVLKAHGRGLAYGLERVAFELTPHGTRPKQFSGPIGAVDEWHCQTLHPQADLAGTLAWRGASRDVSLLRAVSV
ncbi:MAG TPA: 4'-phosphopantetheinyl transferase superfamily protein [Rhodanobacteraceae bacterium]